MDRPSVVVLDVNETLSDTTALADRFAKVGAPGHLASTWFAQVLRDGFALTCTGDAAPFAAVAEALLAAVLADVPLDRPYEDAAAFLLDGFAAIPLHPDVAPGLGDLAELGVRLVTLSNGATATTGRLLANGGVEHLVERLLSVEDAPTWKPGAGAYRWAATRCEAQPEQLMLVAVHPWDVHGATRAGLRTAWVNRDGRAYTPYFAPAELEVSSLVDLAQQLGGR